MVKKIGIVGYGYIGSYLFTKIREDKNLRVAFVHEVDKEKISAVDPSLILDSIEKIQERKPDLTVEVVSAGWVAAHAPAILKFSDILIVSAAALADERLKDRLDTVAKANKTNYYIPHGAILGLDGVRDGKDIIEEVTITTTRPLIRYDLKEKVTQKTVIFEGPVREACKRFPKAINIHASLALHGLGFDKTRSIVVADPRARERKHVIEVKGRGLAWKIDIRSSPLGGKYGPFTEESVFQSAKKICTHEYGMKLV